MIRIKSVLRETFVRTLYHIGYKKAFTLNNIKQAFTEENVSSVAPIMQGIQSDFVIIHNLPLFFLHILFSFWGKWFLFKLVVFWHS